MIVGLSLLSLKKLCKLDDVEFRKTFPSLGVGMKLWKRLHVFLDQNEVTTFDSIHDVTRPGIRSTFRNTATNKYSTETINNSWEFLQTKRENMYLKCNRGNACAHQDKHGVNWIHDPRRKTPLLHVEHESEYKKGRVCVIEIFRFTYARVKMVENMEPWGRITQNKVSVEPSFTCF